MNDRPSYEIATDIANEKRVMELLSQAWGADLHKLPVKYGADYGIYQRNVLKAWLEIKCRNVASTAYPDVILSVEKWGKVQSFAEQTGTKFILVVAFTDGVFFSDETGKVRVAGFGGRTDRKDWQDVEPVVRIPIGELKPVKGGRS